MEKTRRRLDAAGGLLLILLLTAADQYTKHLAVLHLKGQPNIIWIRGVMELEYVENRGAAFGILQNQQWLFILLFFLVIAVMGLLYLRLPADRRYRPIRIVALLIAAGGLGNLIDRVRSGYVVDFFYFSLIDFPVFNMADIYVTVSVFVLLLLFFFYYKEEDLDLVIASLIPGRSDRGEQR